MKLTDDKKEYDRIRYQKNKDSIKARSKEYRKRRPDVGREAMKRFRNKLPKEAAKGRELKYKYGLSWEEYLILYDSQEGSCKICKTPLSLLSENQTKTANVDHCHSTGKIRGLLCGDCNRGIGLLKDSPSGKFSGPHA